LPGKTSSVFPTPCRPVLGCTTYDEANPLSRSLGAGLTKQTFHLFDKMREVDDLLRVRPDLRGVLREAHPELAFARMNGGRPVLSKKRRPEGYEERRRLLAAHGFPCPVDRLPGAARDDILDAIAVCRTALLIAGGEAEGLGSPDARDSAGLPMNIWY
jgi:predicted RNase H-like nuclease